MQKSTLMLILGMSFGLTACGGLPSECADVWDKIAKVAKDSGIPEDAIKNQKKEFEEQIAKLPKEDAIRTCKTQSSVLDLIQ